MKSLQLVKKEIAHRKFVFIMGVFSLAAATAGFTAAGVVLRLHDVRTDQMRNRMEKELRAEMARQEDFYRRVMRDMGYNVLIVHEEQDITEMRTLGHPTRYLDYGDVWKLARGELHTLNHLLPVLQERVFWEEASTEIMLSGIRGQVPVFTKPGFLTDDYEYRSPITERVPAGRADLGFSVAEELALRPGDGITVLGKEFTVNRVYPRRGTADDITVWIPLEDAQSLLGRPGRINGIFALECVCDLDELGAVEAEVRAILPHARVFEYTSLIAARAGVRRRAEEAGREVIRSVMAHREEARREKERLASVLIPVLAAGAGVWIFVLVFSDARARRGEIALLRAVGFGRARILWMFLAKSLLMGLAGGAAGALSGAAGGIIWGGRELAGAVPRGALSPVSLAAGVLLAVIVSAAAGLVPSMLAAARDPADILREE